LRSTAGSCAARPGWTPISTGPSTRRRRGEACLSPHHFHRSFRAILGQSPFAYVARRRIERAQTLLALTEDPVADICAAVGYESLPAFTTRFGRQTGEPPLLTGGGCARPASQSRASLRISYRSKFAVLQEPACCSAMSPRSPPTTRRTSPPSPSATGLHLRPAARPLLAAVQRPDPAHRRRRPRRHPVGELFGVRRVLLRCVRARPSRSCS
jgi:AraC-like DNA-binding protein